MDRYMVEFPHCNTTIRAFIDLESRSVVVTDGVNKRVYHFEALV
jgi:hypothetical protein